MAIEADLPDANAMTLATVGRDGRSSSRILLLKDYSDDGYCFFTNYESRKGKEISENPYAAMFFFLASVRKTDSYKRSGRTLRSETFRSIFYGASHR